MLEKPSSLNRSGELGYYCGGNAEVENGHAFLEFGESIDNSPRTTVAAYAAAVKIIFNELRAR